MIAAIALEGLSRVGPDDELIADPEDPVGEEDDPEELPEEDDVSVWLSKVCSQVLLPATEAALKVSEENIWPKTPFPSPSWLSEVQVIRNLPPAISFML